MRFVPARSLMPGMILGKNIIARNKSFMLAKGAILTEKYVAYLQEKGYLGAYISDDLSDGIEVKEAISPETFEQGVEAVANGDVAEIMSVSRGIVQEIMNNSNVSVDLVDLRSYDDYTYHHSVNVGIYAVAVGKVMGLSSEELIELATAALCHDLGKAKIPQEILNKPGRLSDEEYELIKGHAKHSYDILYDNDSITASIRQSVLMHHENENGTGYPLGRAGDEIPKYAKILHVCDVYDALTSKRPYKDPYSHYKAHEYIEGGKNTLFASEVVDVIHKVLPCYPIGVMVKLSNGEEAVVMEQTKDEKRPFIKLKHRHAVVDLSTNASYKDIVIVASGVLGDGLDEGIDELNEGRSKVKNTKKLVMIVDDSSISLMQTKAAIGSDYEVISIKSGVDAIAYIKNKKIPDLIIMDVEMPVLNGISAVRTIRESGYTQIPVIFLTASCDRETVLKGKAVGATDYIIKPANPTYLRGRVVAALEGEVI